MLLTIAQQAHGRHIAHSTRLVALALTAVGLTGCPSAGLPDTTVDLGPGADLTAKAATGNQVLDGVTVNGPIDLFVNINPGFRILNGLTLNGEIRMTGGDFPFDPFLSFAGPVKCIDGNATISVLSNPSRNSIGMFNGGFLRIGRNVTIRGAAGTFGFGIDTTLRNDGLIHSDLPGLIQIERVFDDRIPDWTNEGTLRTSGGGTLSTALSWTNKGTLHLGVDVTPFESFQDYTQSDRGVLVVEVAGTGVAGSGRLNVTGTAFLDGTLRLEFVDGFTPVAGQTFTVLEYGSHAGQFAMIEAPLLDAGLSLVPTYEPTQLVLTVAQPLGGEVAPPQHQCHP